MTKHFLIFYTATSNGQDRIQGCYPTKTIDMPYVNDVKTKEQIKQIVFDLNGVSVKSIGVTNIIQLTEQEFNCWIEGL